MTENSISFALSIKDSYGIILKDFTFNPKYENNNFIFHLDSPMNIILSNKSTKIFFLNYLRYKKELSSIGNYSKFENLLTPLSLRKMKLLILLKIFHL